MCQHSNIHDGYLSNGHQFHFLQIFKNKEATHEQIAIAGEQLMLKLYGAKKSDSLDSYRHTLYLTRVSKKSLTSDGFQLESLPPTTAAAKFHAYRTYHTVQQWLGNDALDATH